MVGGTSGHTPFIVAPRNPSSPISGIISTSKPVKHEICTLTQLLQVTHLTTHVLVCWPLTLEASASPDNTVWLGPCRGCGQRLTNWNLSRASSERLPNDLLIFCELAFKIQCISPIKFSYTTHTHTHTHTHTLIASSIQWSIYITCRSSCGTKTWHSSNWQVRETYHRREHCYSVHHTSRSHQQLPTHKQGHLQSTQHETQQYKHWHTSYLT